MKHPASISIQDFTYELPPEKIANYPLEKRDESKLLVFKNGMIQQSQFKQLGDFLEKDSLLVFNNTRVIQARLNFKSEKGRDIEVFCLEPSDSDISVAMVAQRRVRWNCLVGNLKQWKTGAPILEKVSLLLSAEIVERRQNFVVIDFSWNPPHLSFAEVLDAAGVMPIPPYLKRESEEVDAERYQTIYAKQKGSVAAPTAGLHFTLQVLEDLKKKQIESTEVTLHVGAGTFKPVKSETMSQHEMHAEWIEVEIEMIDQLVASMGSKKIIAVGTTSLRTIESLYWLGLKVIKNKNLGTQELETTQWEPYEDHVDQPDSASSLEALSDWMKKEALKKIICQTAILIAPPYQLRIASGIITNFHQPQSTLLLLISAVIGDRWKEVYQYAINNNFRFLSYGDSSLLIK